VIIPKELILEAKEKLGQEAARIIAKDLQIGKWVEEDLKGSCPFGHSDSTPSFIWNDKDNCFHCFSCGINYGIIDHYMSFYKMTFLDATKKLFEITNIKYRFGEKGIKTNRQYNYPHYESDDDRTDVNNYCELRKISKETLDYCDVRQNKSGLLMWNFYNENDVLLTVKCRKPRKIQKTEQKEWYLPDFDNTPILYNMNKIDTSNKCVVITEGQFDTLSVIEAGQKNCVSIPGGSENMKWIEVCFDWLNQFDKIIIWFDNDAPGINARREACSRLGTWRTYFIDLPKEIEKDGNTIPVKDANEVLYYFGKQKILDILDTAQETPIENVIDLYDVPEFDIENAPGFYSSSKELNNYINKYLLGTVLILTGRNGNGKSVFLNQEFIAEPLNQGMDVFVYSAELGRPLLKNWIELVAASRDKIELINNTVHRIDAETKKMIREWYKGRIFVYDNDKDLRAESILNKLEAVVRRNGVKVAIIDNLLTVDLNCSQTSEWLEQKKFMVRLINFASEYNIFIVLVAHPRKTDEFRRLTSDDVGGAGAITNLAHLVLSIHKYTKREKEGEKNKKGEYIKGKEPKKYDCN
jgi:twinkle protein